MLAAMRHVYRARQFWIEAVLVLVAALHAALAASATGAVAFAALFTIGNLAFGLYVQAGAAPWLGVLTSGAVMLVLVFAASFLVTIPTAAIVAACAYPFARNLKVADTRLFGAAGFSIGALVWLAIWWNGYQGNLYFGSWISVLAIGGLAGCAGGRAFGRHLPFAR